MDLYKFTFYVEPPHTAVGYIVAESEEQAKALMRDLLVDEELPQLLNAVVDVKTTNLNKPTAWLDITADGDLRPTTYDVRGRLGTDTLGGILTKAQYLYVLYQNDPVAQWQWLSELTGEQALEIAAIGVDVKSRMAELESKHPHKLPRV